MTARAEKDRRDSVFAILRASLRSHAPGLHGLLRLARRTGSVILTWLVEIIQFEMDYRRSCAGLRASPEKKNVLCIVLHMVVGGAERVVLNVAGAVDRERLCFHLITTIPADNVWRGRYEGIFWNVVIPGTGIKNSRILKRYFFRLIRKLRIDIVMISVSPAGYEHLQEMKTKFKRIKVIDLVHSDVRTEKPDWFAGVLEHAMPFVDKRVHVCDGARTYWMSLFTRKGTAGSYAERLLTIPNGIDIKDYEVGRHEPGRFRASHGIPDHARIISFVGRFSEEKNPLLFVEIAENVIAKLAGAFDTRFVMAGDGPEYGQVKERIARDGVGDYFILPGMIDNVPELLRDSYLLAVTSKYEGTPLAVLEAMAMRVPVISNHVGIMPELIEDNVNGYLVDDTGDIVESYTARIIRALARSTDHSAIAEKARDTVIHGYTLDIMGSRYQRLFDELLGNRVEAVPDFSNRLEGSARMGEEPAGRQRAATGAPR